MRFRATSITSGGDVGHRINEVTNQIEDWLNAALGDAEFGPALQQIALIVVAVDDDAAANLKYGADRLRTVRSPLSDEPIRTLQLSLYLPPHDVLSSSRSELFRKVAELAISKARARPKLVPKGFNYDDCARALESALRVYAPSMA